ncbi:MAG TPA: diacylglycerol kinase family protein [Chthoniobacteraceae bacterium]|jgi:diacylglycerol kinase (ATP)|nr:diacylglycerol kinase family protein [Chthoniobacteraceae bacterium]
MLPIAPCFIVNPASGSVKDLDAVSASIRAVFPDATVQTSSECGGAEKLAAAARAEGFGTIVAAGGDGTLNEVVNGIGHDYSGVRLGLLPLGTGNDFARSVDIPPGLDDALAVLAEGFTRRVDLIRVVSSRTRMLINVSAAGFSGSVDEKLTDDVKAAWGPLSYIRGFVAALGELEEFQISLVLDGSEHLDLSGYNVVIANGRYVARGIPIAPLADVADGFADLVIVRTAGPTALALLAPQILAGAHLDNAEILFRRARHISIVSEPPMRFNTDGEFVGDEPATFEVLPAALEMIVGRPAA